MKCSLLFLGIFLIAFSQDWAVENGWQEIKVFQTNRSQVEKILGKPQKEDFETTYSTEDVVVNVIYSDMRCGDSKRLKAKYDLPAETVLHYEVRFLKDIDFSQLILQRENYEYVQDFHLLNLSYYSNLKKGITITIFNSDGNERVSSIKYLPTKEQMTQFKCE